MEQEKVSSTQRLSEAISLIEDGKKEEARELIAQDPSDQVLVGWAEANQGATCNNDNYRELARLILEVTVQPSGNAEIQEEKDQ